jgi:uncharacterized protein (TIGR02246 family)
MSASSGDKYGNPRRWTDLRGLTRPAFSLMILVLPALTCDTGERASSARPNAIRADSQAIQRLHESDMHAVVANDTATLMSLWTDDIVSIAPDGTVRRGRDANAAYLREQVSAMHGMRPLEYSLRFDEVSIRGDLAVEWGSFTSRSRRDAGGDDMVSGGKLMRVLRRTADGKWLVARTIFTVDQPR